MHQRARKEKKTYQIEDYERTNLKSKFYLFKITYSAYLPYPTVLSRT